MKLSLSEWDGKPSSTNKETINAYPKIMVLKVWTVHQKFRDDANYLISIFLKTTASRRSSTETTSRSATVAAKTWKQ